MRYLIIARHGQPDPGNRRFLSERGNLQVNSLVKQLEPFLTDRPVHVFTSPELRARRTAHPIFLKYNLPTRPIEIIQKEELLIKDGRVREGQLGEIAKLAEGAPMQGVLILVTHLELCEVLPAFFSKRILPKGSFAEMTLEHGEAVVLDTMPSSPQTLMTLIRP